MRLESFAGKGKGSRFQVPGASGWGFSIDVREPRQVALTFDF